jgi:hypothetical protein
MGAVKQSYSAVNSQLRGITLFDLYREIRKDTSLSMYQQQQAISQIEGVTRGAPPGTPLSGLMSRGLGGVVGYLIAKYFGMSPIGKVVSTAAGFGLGKVVHDQFNRPPRTDPPGWKMF